MTGRGGWPMTVFLTPDGRPFFGGTYFPASRRSTARPASAVCSRPWTTSGTTAATRSSRQADVAGRCHRPSAPACRHDLAVGARWARAATPASASPGSWPRPRPSWRRASTPPGAGSGPRRSSPSPRWSSCACDHHRVTGDGVVARPWRARPWRPWPPAGSTTTSGVASPATPPTTPGPSRTSRRCSTTRPGWCAPTCTPGRRPVTAAGSRSSRRPSATCSRARRSRGAGCAAPRTPTPRARRAASTCGPRPRWPPRSARGWLAVAADWYGVSERGELRGPQHPPASARGPLWRRPPEVEEARRACSSKPAPRGSTPASTTRSSPSGTPCSARHWPRRPGRRAAGDWAEAAVGIAEFLLTELRRADTGGGCARGKDGTARHLAYAGDYAWVVDFFTRLAELTGRAVWLDDAEEAARAMLRPLRRRRRWRAALHHRERRRAAAWSGRSRSSTAPCPPPTPWPPRALLRLGALRGDDELDRGRRVAAGDVLPGRPRAPAGRAPTPCRPAVWPAAVSPKWWSPESGPISSPWPRPASNPPWSWPRGERTASPLWSGRDDGLGLRMPALRLPGARLEPGRARAPARRRAADDGRVPAGRGPAP